MSTDRTLAHYQAMAAEADRETVRVDVVRELRAANEAIAAAYGSTFDGLIKSILVVEDLIDFLNCSECYCRQGTDIYAAHTCRRCDLLARIGSTP